MFKRVGLWLIISILVLAPTVFANQLIDQSWFVIENEGIPVGLIEEEFWQIDDHYVHTASSELLIDFMGTTITMKEIIDIKLDQDYAITSLNQTFQTNDIINHNKCYIDYSGEQPTATIYLSSSSGHEISEDIILEPGTKVYYPDLFLSKLASSNSLIPDTEYELITLETVEFSFVPATFTIEGKTSFEHTGQTVSGYKVCYRQQGIDVELLVDEDGSLYSTRTLQAASTEIKRINANQVPALESFFISFTSHPSNVSITHPYRTVRSLISLKGTDISLLDLEDNRQKIAGLPTGSQPLQIEIKKDETDYRGRYSLPINEPNLEPYLAGSRYIDPELDDIQSLVTAIIEDQTDAWLAAEKIMLAVFEFIDEHPGLRPLTTTEILETKKGDCNEYAILFASLARAAGIPVKIVEGFRYVNNIWIAHMWNEIWVGEWIAVDPSHCQMAPDALLVKLLEDSSVANLQLRHLEVLTNTNLKIREAESAPRLVDRSLELITGIEGKTYTNADFTCSITIPPPWEYASATEAGFLAYDQKQIANIVFELISIPANITGEYIVDAQMQSLAIAMPDAEILGAEAVEPIVLSGMEGVKAKWGLDLGDIVLYQELVVVISEDQCYAIVFTVPAPYYDHYYDDYKTTLKSLMIY